MTDGARTHDSATSLEGRLEDFPLTDILQVLQVSGKSGALMGTLVAFLPAPFYLALWLWLDRYDPEPAWALAGAWLWGGGARRLRGPPRSAGAGLSNAPSPAPRPPPRSPSSTRSLR